MSTGSFTRFAARRLLAAAALVSVVALSALLLVRLAPGDATMELRLAGADEVVIAETRARLRLDLPVGAFILAWVQDVARLDLGRSSVYGRPVSDLVRERAANTARLAGVALAIAVLIGLPLGVLTGARPSGPMAAWIAPVSVALVSCPPIVGAFGLMLIAVQTGWLSIAPGALAVPAVALALPLAATFERLQSQATADALVAPSITAALARGLSPRRVLWVHVSRQSAQPILGILGVVVGGLFSGSLAVEWITSWPGLGRLMYDAIVGRDLYLVVGCALFGAMLLAVANVLADLLRGVVDPRVRLS